MDVEFADSDLQCIETDSECAGNYGKELARSFRKVMRFIRAAKDERDFRAMRSLNFEKLKGNRSHQYSLRLNRQWRLIIEITKGDPANTVVVKSIEDYH